MRCRYLQIACALAAIPIWAGAQECSPQPGAGQLHVRNWSNLPGASIPPSLPAADWVSTRGTLGSPPTPTEGVWVSSILDNTVKQTDTTAGVIHLAYETSHDIADAVVQTCMTYLSNPTGQVPGGLLFRIQDPQHFYGAGFVNLSGTMGFILGKLDGANARLLAAPVVGLNPTSRNHVEVRLTGPEISVKVNGALVFDRVRDPDTNRYDTGKIGLGTYSSSVRFGPVWADFAQASVLTQHNDAQRTGANLQETILNHSNVSSDFGLLFARPVDGQIYAQPLYVPSVTIPGAGVRNVVYVATMKNTVYAFDADETLAAHPLWQTNLGPSLTYNFIAMSYSGTLLEINIPIPGAPIVIGPIFVPSPAPGLSPTPYPPGTYNIWPDIGITSTPVIDPATQTMYVVAKVNDPLLGISYWLHALDIRTGSDLLGKSPVLISGHVSGSGADSVGGVVTFDPVRQHNRPGLLLSNGLLYVAFASHQDTPTYHGWVMAYDAEALRQVAIFNTTPDGKQGGIWQAGNGLAADQDGAVYFMTGNGTFSANKGGRDYGGSFVKLGRNPVDFSVVDWFSPCNQEVLNGASDLDLGSAGPVVLPEMPETPNTHLLVGGGKQGMLYLLDRDGMGHFPDPAISGFSFGKETGAKLPLLTGDRSPCPEFRPTFTAASFCSNSGFAVDTIQITERPRHFPDTRFPVMWCGEMYSHIHGSPVYWSSTRPWLYVWPENSMLQAIDLTGGRFAPAGTSAVTAPPGMPGGILSLSANGSLPETGIVWATHPRTGDALNAVQPGILRAFDATNVSCELWNSELEPRDRLDDFAKYTPPTVANGKVYVATFSRNPASIATPARLMVYGLRSPGGTAAHDDPPACIAAPAPELGQAQP